MEVRLCPIGGVRLLAKYVEERATNQWTRVSPGVNWVSIGGGSILDLISEVEAVENESANERPVCI